MAQGRAQATASTEGSRTRAAAATVRGEGLNPWRGGRGVRPSGPVGPGRQGCGGEG